MIYHGLNNCKSAVVFSDSKKRKMFRVELKKARDMLDGCYILEKDQKEEKETTTQVENIYEKKLKLESCSKTQKEKKMNCTSMSYLLEDW